MNAVEIEEAVSRLAEQPFDAGEFPYAFLEAFGNKPTTLQRLRSGSTNQSDLGGVLQRSNIHLKVCPPGEVAATLKALRESPKTISQKAKFILATDGIELQAESLEGEGETLACDYPKFADHFGFFLPLAGISTVRQIRENAFDIKATGRLNRLYIELLKDNPEWATAARREDLNHFMARVIFCFFAEDTNIFHSESLFTATVDQMSARDSSNTHEVISELFRAMNTKLANREAEKIRPWANVFPYVNGGLFSQGAPTPSSASASVWRSRGYIPHRDDYRLVQHITFRLADSLPQEKLRQLEMELEAMPAENREVEKRKKIEQWLDAGMGCCALAHPEAAAIVQNTLLHSDEDSYRLIAWCIMPNHVHVLIKPESDLASIIQAWKSISARRILALNERLSLKIPDPKHLWFREYWDRYIRDDSHFQSCIDYIRLNPVKAGLCRKPEDWPWSGNTDGPIGVFPHDADGGVGAPSVPRFSKIARSYLLHVGNLDWTKINPDIFGSMIQAVADDEERGALGMHYTSVPNILKVLNPLFLDELRARLEEAGNSPQKLLNLRKRIARIRVFDPACGSGNFLVIAYKQLREIEAEINRRRGEADRKSEIPLTNFRGIEIRHFSCEIARLALIIAEYQCDVIYRGQQLALAEFLPLEAANWITCGNALRLDWLSLCPPTGKGVKNRADDLFNTPLDQAEIDFENEGGETYICGNPPYQGSVNQTVGQKQDMADVFSPVLKKYKDLDYVAAFLLKAARYNQIVSASSAFVTTNSVTQGEQVAMLWPLLFNLGNEIAFAHTSFLWSNLASHKAAVTCVIIGLSTSAPSQRSLFSADEVRIVPNISPYLVATDSVIVSKRTSVLSEVGSMQSGNKPTDGGHLILDDDDRAQLLTAFPEALHFVKRYVGSKELINGGGRWCLWIEDAALTTAKAIPAIRKRIEAVRKIRSESRGSQANENTATPHRFVFAPHTHEPAIAVPNVSSERRGYLPCDLTNYATVVSNLASVIYDAPLWNLALIASKLHLVWIGTVCGKLKTDYRYSNTLGWNTFPVPPLTEQNKTDLTRCAEDILLAREAHFPATIAELYDPAKMPADLRAAHDRNDETLERIYIGRRFKNDTERLEKLFELYTKMTARAPAKKAVSKRAARRKSAPDG